jgi:FtsH-binding integral membrane protein
MSYSERRSFAQARTDPTDILGNIGKIFTSLENKLEKDVRDHLKNVYGTLTICLMTAVVGAVTNWFLNLHSFHFLFSIGIFGLTFAIVGTTPTQYNEKKRLSYLFALAFLVGCTTGPLVEYVGAQDPSIVFNAYIITMIVFGCFSLAALHAPSTKFLHLGGILSSALLCLFITALFARNAYVHSLIIWGGLAVNCGFVVYDTQLIAEKRRRGDIDYIWHTVELFIDFVNIFRYLLIILKEKNDRSNRRRD